MVRNTLLVVLWIIDESWIALDSNSGDFVCCAVHLCNHNVFQALDKLAKFGPDWSERLAVAAPGSVVLDKHVLSGISHNVLPVVAYDGLYWSIVVLGNGFGLKMGLELVCFEVVDKLADAFNGQLAKISFVSILLKVVSKSDHADSWLGFAIDSDIVSELLLDSICCS